jgi:hypothetical protein
MRLQAGLQQAVNRGAGQLGGVVRAVQGILRRRSGSRGAFWRRGIGSASPSEVFGLRSRFSSCRLLGLTAWIGPAMNLPAEHASTLKWHNAFNWCQVAARRHETEPTRWDLEVAMPIMEMWGTSNAHAVLSATYAVEMFGAKNYDALEAGRKGHSEQKKNGIRPDSSSPSPRNR